jgi:transcriptional regulator with XRE-family HTH domain
MALCVESNIAPSKVAEAVGFTRSAASGWKSGRCKPSDLTVRKVARFFGVPLSYFIEQPEQKDAEVAALKRRIEELEKDNNLLRNILEAILEKREEAAR